MNIEAVGDNLTDFLKDNGAKIGIALGGGMLLYVLIKNVASEGDVTVIAPNGYTSYPSAEKNANVIIDQVNQHTTYENELTRDDIADLGDYVSGRFDSTDGYIKDGFENVNANLDRWGNSIIDNQDKWGNDIITNQDKWGNDIIANQDKWGNDLSGQIGSLGNQIGSLGNRYDETIESLGDKLDQMKPSTGGGGHIIEELPEAKPSNASYYKQFQYGGNWDSNSIVDGFKSIGIFSNDGKRIDTVASRKEIAEANGIKNYTGTQAQNDKLVALGKQGKLKKPD